MDQDFNIANNTIFFRLNEKTLQTEMCIVKMEGCSHPLGWLPFRTINKDIEMLKE